MLSTRSTTSPNWAVLTALLLMYMFLTEYMTEPGMTLSLVPVCTVPPSTLTSMSRPFKTPFELR